MSHSEDYRFSQYEPFQKRVAAALSRAATYIISESDATENYAARQPRTGAATQISTLEQPPASRI